MSLNLFPQFKAGDKIRLRPMVVSVFAQYLPVGAVGTVKASYMKDFGVRLREELEIIFPLNKPDAPIGAMPVDVEMRGIVAEQVERA